MSSSGAGGADDYLEYFDGSGGGIDSTHLSKPKSAPASKDTCLMWNPEIPTQFLVANDDD